MGLGVLGKQVDRPGVFGDGLVQLAAHDVKVGQIVVGFGVIGFVADGVGKKSEGFIEDSLLQEQACQVPLGDGKFGPGGDCLTDEIDGSGSLPGLAGQDAEEVEGVGLLGILLKNLAVNLFRIGKSPGLMMSNGVVDIHWRSLTWRLSLYGGLGRGTRRDWQILSFGVEGAGIE